jgi:hypothetical protein
MLWQVSGIWQAVVTAENLYVDDTDFCHAEYVWCLSNRNTLLFS